MNTLQSEKAEEVEERATLSQPTKPYESEFSFFPFLKRFFKIYFEREGKEGRKRGRETSMCERNIDWLPLLCAPIGDQTHNLSMCRDWESNQWPFSLWDDAQPTESHQSGLLLYFYNNDSLHLLSISVANGFESSLHV